MNDRLDKSEEPPESFGTVDEAADCWDTHSTADDWEVTRPVEFQIDGVSRRLAVGIERDLADRLRSAAKKQGVTLETLVNLWLQERLTEPPRAA